MEDAERQHLLEEIAKRDARLRAQGRSFLGDGGNWTQYGPRQ